jgi:hypothetical protein
MQIIRYEYSTQRYQSSFYFCCQEHSAVIPLKEEFAQICPEKRDPGAQAWTLYLYIHARHDKYHLKKRPNAFLIIREGGIDANNRRGPAQGLISPP